MYKASFTVLYLKPCQMASRLYVLMLRYFSWPDWAGCKLAGQNLIQEQCCDAMCHCLFQIFLEATLSCSLGTLPTSIPFGQLADAKVR